MTSEEKIDAVYTMLKDNQARSSRIFWYKIFKWAIILGIAYFTLTHPGYVAGKITEYIQPIVIEQMKTIMTNEKDGFLDQLKKIMPASNQETTTPQY